METAQIVILDLNYKRENVLKNDLNTYIVHYIHLIKEDDRFESGD